MTPGEMTGISLQTALRFLSRRGERGTSSFFKHSMIVS